MKAAPFQASRSNGRSDRRVILDIATGSAAGTVFTFADLQSALESDTDREITRAKIGAAVRAANVWLLREEKRVLHSVEDVGYRVAHASEHQGLALVRKRRADRQLMWGVKTLQHVRWDEMDANTRTAHEAQLMIMSGLYAAIQSLNKRQTRLEKLVKRAVGDGSA